MEDIPVPIPNTEVKLHSAESSWGIAPCEGRTLPCGGLAQLGERLPYKQRVTGSSPVVPTTFGPVVQLVRTPACHAGGRGFEPHLSPIVVF